MEKAAIYHQPASHYAFSYDGFDLHIRIRAKKDDIKKVTLICADPYDYENEKWMSERLEMKKIATTEEHDYFAFVLKPERRRVQYGFILEDFEGDTIFYGGRGFFEDTLVNLNTMDYYFKFPFIHEVDTFKAPEWVKNTIWYQIFPERFANGEPSLSPENALPWGSKDPSTTDFFGGDLVGIIEHLDYLENLGINGIYMTPIFEAPTNHKYDTLDYMKIDPHFGDEETFRKLVDEAHKRGIKVMLDAVFNHIGDTSEMWQDVVQNEEKSRYKDWFHVHSFPVRYGENGNVENATSISYDTFAFTTHMPKLNTSHPDVQKYLLDIAAYWIREFDIDGWRLDVANEVDHAFWKKFRQVVRNEKEDVYILGEIWHDSWIWLLGDEFDAVMNYPFTQTIIENFIENKISPEKMVASINEQYMRYPKQVSEVMFNMLDSHDTARILTRADGNKDKVKQALAFMFAHTGSPCIYYGTEIGMDGANDPLCRKCMVWEEAQQDLEMLAFTKRLIAIRKEYQALISRGELIWDISRVQEGLVIFKRELDGEALTFIFNQAKEEKAVRVEAGVDVFHDEKLGAEVIVPKEGFRIVK
ncbi:glycoside hydrolase family 13 protein [Listeria goaensis]|uniref:glycoside hydrolase family 13 protein n=1 Tax=Listeria goaensis TaxID=1649188 RepID=UPI000B58C4B5|nr:glycoside hydrolase family 13 protein [Listeria goaensis]